MEDKQKRKVVVMNNFNPSQGQLDQYATRIAEMLYQITEKEKGAISGAEGQNN